MAETHYACPDCGSIDLEISGEGLRDVDDKSLARAECPNCAWAGALKDTVGFATTENVFTAEIIGLKADIARLEALPKIVAEMVRPAEKIDSIRIHHIGGGREAAASGEATANPPVNQALDSIMDMAVQLPALRKIGEELGVSFEDGMSGVVDDGRRSSSDDKA